MQVQAVYEATTERQIRRAAEETLRAWPEAMAAVLFGSRARGDNRPDSDWDIAFITRAANRVPGDVPLEMLAERFHIQTLALPEGLLRRKCNAPGHIAYHIARQGRVVAGNWNRPVTEENPPMQEQEFNDWMDGSLAHLVNAATQLTLVAAQGGVKETQLFVASSSQAAEHLVKAMLYRRGCDVPQTHDVQRLAERLADAVLQAQAVALNGDNHRHHMADYMGVEPGDCEIAGRRCVRMVALWTAEIKDAASDPALSAGAARLARKMAVRARQLAGQLRTAAVDGAPPPADVATIAAALEQRAVIATRLEMTVGELGQLLSGPEEHDQRNQRSRPAS